MPVLRFHFFFFLSIIISVASLAVSVGDHPGQEAFAQVSSNSPDSVSHEARIQLKVARGLMDTLPEKGLEIVCKVFAMAIREQDIRNKAESYELIGYYYMVNRKYLRAMLKFDAAINNFALIHDTLSMIAVKERNGFINMTLQHYEHARVFFNTCLKWSMMVRDSNNIGRQYLHLGQLEQATGHFHQSDSCYRIAIHIFKRMGNTERYIQGLVELGNKYLLKNQLPEALKYYQHIDSLADANRIRIFRGLVLTKISHIWSLNHDYLKAAYYSLKALQARKQYSPPAEVNSALVNLAGDYLRLGRADTAMVLMKEGMSLAVKYKQRVVQINGYRHLYQYYESVKDYRNAQKYLEMYNSLQETLELDRLRTDYKITSREVELQEINRAGVELSKENEINHMVLKKQQYPLIITSILTVAILITLVVLTIIFFVNRKARKKLQDVYDALMVEVRESELKSQQIIEEEQKFRFLSEHSIDFIVHYNNELKIIYASPTAMNFFGYLPEELIGKTPVELTHPDFHANVQRLFAGLKNIKKEQHLLYQAQRRDGDSFWVETVANPVFDRDSNEFKGVVAVVRDIHERKLRDLKQYEGMKQKENLLKEIHHRVKNNFAILVSLINMQISQYKDPHLQKALTNLQLRVRSMSLVHEMLYRSEDFENISIPEYIRSLSSVVASTLSRKKIRMVVEVESGHMNIDTAIPVGLILTELITNCFTHAYVDRDDGTVQLSFTKLNEEGYYRLTIQDDGCGLPEGFHIETVQTMGLQIVQLLCKQLDARLTIEAGAGTTFMIDILLQPG